MTDNEKATRLIYRIQSTLATLARWAANELDRFADVGADSMDVTTLEHVSRKLDGVEDAWNESVKYARDKREQAAAADYLVDGAQLMADANDEQRTQADANDVAVQ